MSDLKEPPTTLLDQLMKKSNQWKVCNFEFPVDYACGFAYDAETERVYVAGGWKDGKRHDKLYEIELVKDASSSSLLPRIARTFDLPHGRGIAHCVCVKLHNKLYVIGGSENGCKYLNDVYSFDTTIGTWEKEASMNTKRSLPSVVSTKRGTIMVCGGIDNSSRVLDTCEEYSDFTKQWTALPCRLKEARYHHVSICHESRVVVIGGYNNSSKPPTPLATTEVMDMGSSNPQWNSGPRLVEKRDTAALSILGDYVVIAGGWNGNERLRSLEAIATRDLANGVGEWRLLSGCEMNERRFSVGMVLIDGCLLFFGWFKTCEMLDVSMLLANAPFYERLLQQDERYTMEHRLETLATVVRNAHETKIFYTYSRQCIRQGLVDSSEGSDILKSGLEASIGSCVCEDAVDMYMMILDKAEADVVATQKDVLRHVLPRYTTQAGTKPQTKCHPTFVNNMQKTVETNMQRVGGVGHGVETLRLQVLKLKDMMERVRESLLEHQHCFFVGQSSGRQAQQNVEKVNESMHALKRHRSEAVALFITSVLNAIAIGVDNSLTEGFEKFLACVVDFGDPAHVLEVMNFCLEKPESEELGDVYSTMKKQFERGVELAAKESRDELADGIKEGGALVALGAVSTLASVESNDAHKGIAAIRGNKEDTHAATLTTADIPNAFRDCILSEDDEGNLPIHAAVKFADMGPLKRVLEVEDYVFSEGDYVLSMNTLDSEGRTALDLAALTGHLDMVKLLTSHEAEYAKLKSWARVTFVAKARHGKHDEYLEYLQSLV